MVKAMNKKFWKIITVGVLSVLIIIFVKNLYSKSDEISPEKCFIVEKGDIEDSLDLQGTLSSENIKDVLSGAAGIVEKVNVSINDLVDIDKVIIKLENEDLLRDLPIKKRSLELAEFEVNTIKNKYDQSNILFEKGGISKDELDRAYLDYQKSLYNTYETAKKAYQEINDQIESLDTKAPFLGMITDIFIKEGESVIKGQKLFSIVDVEYPMVIISASKIYANVVRVGQEVVCNSSVTGEIKGKVINIKSDYNSKENKNEFVTIICKPDKVFKNFFYGLTLDVKIILNKKNNVIRVPIAALIEKNDNSFCVLKKQNDSFVEQSVLVGMHNTEFVEIIKGLAIREIISKDVTEV